MTSTSRLPPAITASDILTPRLRTYKFWNTTIAETVSLLLSLILFYFILTKSTKQLRPYRKILLIGNFVDMFLAIVFLCFGTSMFNIDDVYFVVTEGVFGSYIPVPINLMAIFSAYFSAYLTVCVAPIQYVFRALLISRNTEIGYGVVAVLLAVAMTAAAVMAGSICKHFYPTAQMFAMYNRYFDDSWRDADGRLPSFGASNINDMRQALPYCPAVFGTCYAIIFVCVYAIMRRMNELRSLSAKMKDFQRQISCVLFIQAFMPFITVVIPVAFDWLTVLRILFVPQAGVVAIFLIIWSPIVNPVCTLFVIRTYREAFLAPFCRFTRQFASKSCSNVDSVDAPANAPTHSPRGSRHRIPEYEVEFHAIP